MVVGETCSNPFHTGRGSLARACPDCDEYKVLLGQDVPNYGAEAIREQINGQPLSAVVRLDANSRQIGGAHYGKITYQHWDYVCDSGMHYLLACASKYVTRWRDKGGVQDLEKCCHYLQKAAERDIAPASRYGLDQFVAQLPTTEANIVRQMVYANYAHATGLVRSLIESAA